MTKSTSLFDVEWKVDLASLNTTEKPSDALHPDPDDNFIINLDDDFIIDLEAIERASRPEYPVVAADITLCDAGVVDVSFECPWGCTKGRGRWKRPRRHLHGGDFAGGPISLGHRVTHCHQPDAPSGYVLVPANVPDGYEIDPDDPYRLVPTPRLRIVDSPPVRLKIVGNDRERSNR